MYHFCESIGVNKFFLIEGEWHKLGKKIFFSYKILIIKNLDNIGAIMCFVNVIIRWTDMKDESKILRT